MTFERETTMPLDLTVLVITKDEALNLPHLLESIRDLGVQIFVVDSGSTDETVAIAQQYGAQVVEHPFVSHAEQINWGLDHLPTSTTWVMRMDADEYLTPELVAELRATLPSLPDHVTGLMVKRRVHFMGRWIRHGGLYPTWLLRVFRNGVGRSENRIMDEHIVLSHGEVRNLKHDIIDENHRGLRHFTNKHNNYAHLEMQALLAEREARATSAVTGGQAQRKRWLKGNVYSRAPLFLRAGLYYLLRYVFQLGFLDGIPGLIFHGLQGLWYRFYVDALLYAHQRREYAVKQRETHKQP